MPPTTLNVAVVGLGYWGSNLLRAFGTTPGVRIAALCDREEHLLAQPDGAHPDARRTTEYADVLTTPGIDAVVLATPPASHHALALAALRAGMHVWLEKPLALTAAHGRELVEAARTRGRVLFVDETFLYDPLVGEMKRLIDEGALGRVHHLSFERLGLGRIRRDSNVWWNSGPHDLAILFHLVPRRVLRARLHEHAHLRDGIADMAVCDLELEGGVSAHVYRSWLHPEKTASVTVVGSQRMLRYEGRFEKRSLTLYDYALDTDERHGNLVPVRQFAARPLEVASGTEPLAIAVAHFVESIRTGGEPPSSGGRSLRVVEVLERAEHAATRHSLDA